MPASLIATGSAAPEGSSGLNEQTRLWVQVAGLTVNEGPVMCVDGSHVLVYPTRVEPLVMRNQSLWRKRSDPPRSVQRSEDEPPAGQAVSAGVGRPDKAVVRAAADPVV